MLTGNKQVKSKCATQWQVVACGSTPQPWVLNSASCLLGQVTPNDSVNKEGSQVGKGHSLRGKAFKSNTSSKMKLSVFFVIFVCLALLNFATCQKKYYRVKFRITRPSGQDVSVTGQLTAISTTPKPPVHTTQATRPRPLVTINVI